ncbi:hypothetical protein [Pilimelia anulata]|uniref:hypothetical protein n=1 Tax=Pilimelia anulata TaxID=53371 RepID=UPI00166E10F3|nr:hypothetical protein [Pilimelia anulata]
MTVIVVMFLSAVAPMPASAAELPPCRLGEGNSGQLNVRVRNDDLEFSGWVRRCRSVPGPEGARPWAFGWHNMREFPGVSGVEPMSPAYPPGQRFVRRFTLVFDTSRTPGHELLCLHAEMVALDCWYVVTRSVAGGGTRAVPIGQVGLRPPFDDDTAVPRPNCGTCW